MCREGLYGDYKSLALTVWLIALAHNVGFEPTTLHVSFSVTELPKAPFMRRECIAVSLSETYCLHWLDLNQLPTELKSAALPNELRCMYACAVSGTMHMIA